MQQKDYWDPNGILDNIKYESFFNDKGKPDSDFEKNKSRLGAIWEF